VLETHTASESFYHCEETPAGTYALSMRASGAVATAHSVVTVAADANAVVEQDFGLYVLPQALYVPVVLR